jgi:hypothetical protein
LDSGWEEIMTNIIELAKEAGWTESTWEGFLTKFSALVREDERMNALEVARTIGGDWAEKFEQEYLK